MTKQFKAIAAGMVSIFALAAAAPVVVSAHGYRDKGPNIVEKALAINQENGEFSTLIAAASCTNIASRLSNEHRRFTLFAPTDAAFAKLNLNANNVCSSFDSYTLTNILKYHVTRGNRDASQVLSCKSLLMLNHNRAPINASVPSIAGQKIISTDVVASNGIIHVIDGVMLP